MRSILRLFDWPPVWLAGFLVLAWGLDSVLPGGWFGQAGRVAGAVLVLAGLALMGAAVAQMARARTTVIPRQDPSALVTGGVFRLTRNPIYLGDALVLTGAILWWDVVPALLLVPLFVRVIRQRFILGEEARLEAAFGAAFRDWTRQTRRWI